MFCRTTILSLAMSLLFTSSYGWGKRGHDIICYIAECHLSDNAMERVSTLLDGRSMVYYGNWMDGASRTPRYSETLPWHYFNMERGESVESCERSKNGDLLYAAKYLEATLRSDDSTPEVQSVALKMFIHIIGDMHQPLHLGHEDDEGGGLIPVVYFVESANLHSVWDYHLVMGVHEWSYTEWQQQIDRLSKSQEEAVIKGDYAAWMNATHDITQQIYRDRPNEKRIYYDYLDRYTPIVEQQLLYAGIRLAHLLNQIYQ